MSRPRENSFINKGQAYGAKHLLNPSIFCKKILSSLLFHSGIIHNKLTKFHDAGIFIVLMYHRITPPCHTLQDGMYVTPQTFSSHLRFLKKNFTVVSTKDLASIMESGTVQSQEKTMCVLTFDDGWLDFYTFAYPLLVSHGLPATVFLPTSFIGSENKFWTERFAFLMSHRLQKGKVDVSAFLDNEHEIAEVVVDLLAMTGQFKEQLENGIELLKALPLPLVDRVLEVLVEIWNVPDKESERDFVNWEEVQEMLYSGFVSFGSHTISHQILTTLSADDIKSELSGSQKELIDRKAAVEGHVSFCYPNGSYSPAIAELVQLSSYELAVTTKKGVNNKFSDRFMLNRIGIHQDMASTVPLFAARIAGFI